MPMVNGRYLNGKTVAVLPTVDKGTGCNNLN